MIVSGDATDSLSYKMYQKCFLDYDHNFFVEQEYKEEPTSCIKHQINELDDIHKKYGGFPETYTFANTKIHQLWYTNEQIDFEAIGKQLGVEVVTVSSIKQPPDDKRLKVRANIYLQDWKMGQFIQYDDTVDVKWKAGDGHIWDSNVLHVSANAGFDDKYTLQVSGFLL